MQNIMATSSSSDDDDDDDILALLTMTLCTNYLTKRSAKKRRFDSGLPTHHEAVIPSCPAVPVPVTPEPVFPVEVYIPKVLQLQDDQFFERFRMSRDVFIKLRNQLIHKAKLRDTHSVGVDEQLAIFLETIGHNARCRELQEKYKHSGETISRYFNSVLNAILALKDEYIQTPGTATSPVLRFNKEFYPYFKNCIGVIGGTYIPVTVRKEDQAWYLNKKGIPSQNVMAVISFDRTFAFVAAGRAGSMSNMEVLLSAIEKDGFKVPEDKYYLVDSSHANLPNFIAPYLSSPCRLGDFTAGKCYSGPAEIFNHRHAKLRDVVKGTLSVLKERFSILKLEPKYPYPTQIKLVIAACIIHNFIRREQMEDPLFEIYDQENFEMNSDIEEAKEDACTGLSDIERIEGEKIRGDIAGLLWSALTRVYAAAHAYAPS